MDIIKAKSIPVARTHSVLRFSRCACASANAIADCESARLHVFQKKRKTKTLERTEVFPVSKREGEERGERVGPEFAAHALLHLSPRDVIWK